MQPRLLDHALAAKEWGWCEGTVLRDYDIDEYLRELRLYIMQHVKPQRRWVERPYFKPVYRKRNAIDEVEDVLVVRMHDDLQWRHDGAWSTVSISELTVERGCIRRQVLYRMVVQFVVEQFVVESESLPLLSATVTHLVENNNGCYYINILDWIARCADPRECVDLLDAIESNIHALYLEYEMRRNNYVLIKHFDRSLRFTNDEVRGAYARRMIERLSRDFKRSEFVL